MTTYTEDSGTTPTLVHVADRDPSTYRRAEA